MKRRHAWDLNQTEEIFRAGFAAGQEYSASRRYYEPGDGSDGPLSREYYYNLFIDGDIGTSYLEDEEDEDSIE